MRLTPKEQNSIKTNFQTHFLQDIYMNLKAKV